MDKFPKIVSAELKYYVYIYSNPITDEIFYVGKGKGDRVFAHLNEESESEKVKYLFDLKTQGLRPRIEILIHGIENEEAALRVESAIIDLIGVNKLTNKQSGWRSATFGRMTLQQIISTYSKQKVEIDEPAILIRINQAFRYSMSEIELYDYTRGQWKINVHRANNAKYAFAVYEGIIQEVYSVLFWLEAGRTLNTRAENGGIKDRFEFIGNIAESEIRNKYKYKSVEHYFKKGNANPIMYLNC
jgi:uncharacterized protein